uniref:BTB domain-containing protein n=1 Tax=Branchiostoma floridae TaxID=7739 RepID=C3YUZ2_BRAFL|eukprot:XP_002599843.1 hypothetical protein BRAFLDRAFT_95533 [Branchiostoma floridae]
MFTSGYAEAKQERTSIQDVSPVAMATILDYAYTGRLQMEPDQVQAVIFPCHRAVLASCSPYFRGMFTSGYAEAKQERTSIQDVSPVAMATILDYAYTGRLQMEPDQVDFVCKEAVEYMKNHLDVSNCADVLMYADMLGDLDLVEYSGRYIASRFNKVVLQPSFLQLPLALLQSLLTRDDLLTNSEDDVVQAALRWVEFDQDERLRHLPNLCRSFRHSFLSSNQLVDLEKKCPSSDIKLVYSDRTTRRLGQARTEMQIFLRDDSTKSAPCYNPSTGELYTMNMPDDSVGYSMVVTPRDDLYVAGGVVNCQKIPHDFKGCKKLKTFYEYNHLLNTWEQRCDMISPRVRCGLVHMKGYIYAIGGDDAKKTVERYDPSRDEWTTIPPLPHPMSMYFSSVALRDSVYVISDFMLEKDVLGTEALYGGGTVNFPFGSSSLNCEPCVMVDPLSDDGLLVVGR